MASASRSLRASTHRLQLHILLLQLLLQAVHFSQCMLSRPCNGQRRHCSDHRATDG